MEQINAKPLVSSISVGLVASLCCGGSLVFASVGLGAFYGALGLSRYIPQALAAGALCIVIINYFFYRRAGERSHRARAGNILHLREVMFSSAALGLVAMAMSFVFLEWLNHAVVNPLFVSRPEYGQALIPGVPNVRLLYALASSGRSRFFGHYPGPASITQERECPQFCSEVCRRPCLPLQRLY
jgi:hypothetical protein